MLKTIGFAQLKAFVFSLGFSIRAFDGAGNVASPSNVAPITYLLEYPEIDATGDGYNLRASINLFIMLIVAVFIVIM